MTEPCLSPDELRCLRHLSRYVDAEPGPCRLGVLDALVARGLVERTVLLALPVLGQPARYRLTRRGRRLLNSLDGPV